MELHRTAQRGGPPARTVVAVLAALLLGAGMAAAEPSGSSTAREALLLCRHADTVTGDEREQALERGLKLAERAVAADARDALAHFATVCNLGRQMESAGMGIGQLFKLRRLRRELDATLELAPTDSDTLVAKGALLLRLPRLLGGDAVEAEKLLRRALDAEPGNGTARCYLAHALSVRDASPDEKAAPAESTEPPHC